MRCRKLWVPLAALAALFYLAAGLEAQDPGEKDRRATDRSTTTDRAATDRSGTDGRDSLYHGQIVKVEASRRELVLDTALATETGVVPKRDKAPEKDQATDRGTPKDTVKDRVGKERSRPVTFTVPESARVTLDGKRAALRDLKGGHFARIMARRGEAGVDLKDRGTDRGQGTERDVRGRGDRPEARLVAERVDGFTQGAGERGRGDDRDRGTKDRGTDRRTDR
jgi:hypothetical protein